MMACYKENPVWQCLVSSSKYNSYICVLFLLKIFFKDFINLFADYPVDITNASFSWNRDKKMELSQ